MFGLDASVAACWCLPDESHPIADAARTRIVQEDAIVPAIFRFELLNVLLMAERRGRISEAHLTGFVALINELPIKVD
jgi:predicted nucleic acid-binding protein